CCAPFARWRRWRGARNGRSPSTLTCARTDMGSNINLSLAAVKTGRLLSIDALRGFDMFWIVGGEELVKAFAKWANLPWYEQIHNQLEHVEWQGFHFYDLIFPLFLFIVGVVVPFSLGKMKQQKEPVSRIYGRIARRTVLLFLLGMLYSGDFRKELGDWRIAGVLQRIALC